MQTGKQIIFLCSKTSRLLFKKNWTNFTFYNLFRNPALRWSFWKLSLRPFLLPKTNWSVLVSAFWRASSYSPRSQCILKFRMNISRRPCSVQRPCSIRCAGANFSWIILVHYLTSLCQYLNELGIFRYPNLSGCTFQRFFPRLFPTEMCMILAIIQLLTTFIHKHFLRVDNSEWNSWKEGLHSFSSNSKYEGTCNLFFPETDCVVLCSVRSS